MVVFSRQPSAGLPADVWPETVTHQMEAVLWCAAGHDKVLYHLSNVRADSARRRGGFLVVQVSRTIPPAPANYDDIPVKLEKISSERNKAVSLCSEYTAVNRKRQMKSLQWLLLFLGGWYCNLIGPKVSHDLEIEGAI
jgi:hypothetical protein